MMRKTKKQKDDALSTQTMENLFPSKRALRLCEQVSRGKISADEAVAAEDLLDGTEQSVYNTGKLRDMLRKCLIAKQG